MLVRHAQTSSNVAGALDTKAPGADLTELGRRQAEAAAVALVERKVAGIHVSSLVRTQQTAAPLAAATGMSPTVHEGLSEISAGSLEMHTDLASRESYAETVIRWLGGALDEPLGGAGNGHEFLARYDAAIAAIAATGAETVAAFSHGAAIRTWVVLRTSNPDELSRLAAATPGGTGGLANTGCIEVEGDPTSGWRAVAWHGGPLGGAALDSPDGYSIAR